jgi:hypothetical protein
VAHLLLPQRLHGCQSSPGSRQRLQGFVVHRAEQMDLIFDQVFGSSPLRADPNPEGRQRDGSVDSGWASLAESRSNATMSPLAIRARFAMGWT